MEETTTTGVTVSNSGGLGWLDGLLQRGYAFLDATIAAEFPEQFTHVGANDVVRDSAVDAELAGSWLNPDNVVRIGLVVAGLVAVAIVLKKL